MPNHAPFVPDDHPRLNLEQLVRAPPLQPTDEDIKIGQQLIDFLRHLPAKTTAAQAAPQLKMVPGTRSQREVLIDILGVRGILHTPGHPGYGERAANRRGDAGRRAPSARDRP